jgi:chitinase
LFDLDDCAVRLVTDGYVTFYAEAEMGSSGTSTCYGVDVGASIYADIKAPNAMKWALPRTLYYIVPGVERQV